MRKRVCLALFLLCAAGMIWLFGVETRPQWEPVPLTPEGGLPDISYAGELELSYSLPAWEGSNRPMLEIRSLYGTEAELLLDGAPFQQIPAGLGWVYGTLPGDYAGKTLTLRMEKGEHDALPILYLTDETILQERARADVSLRAFSAAAFGAVFLLTLGLFLYGWAEGARPWPMLLLSAAALGQTVHFYLDNFPPFTLPSALYGLALHQSRALLFAAPPLYLLLGMKKRRRLFAPFAILPALFYWVVAGFQTAVPLFSRAAVYAGVPYYLTAAALVVCSVLEYRDGNPVFRLALPGGAAAAAAALGAAALAAPSTLAMFLRAPFFWIESGLFWWNTLLLALCFVEGGLTYIRQRARQEAELQVLSARESLIRDQLATVQESAAALKKLRHEAKNHYLVLQNLSNAGEQERLAAYLQELVSEVTAIPAFSYSRHPVVNAVLTVMLARAQKQGIEVDHRADVPEALPFPDTELCTVLMNLLQNALDANALAPEGVRKWLRTGLHVRGAYLYIWVENTRFAPVDYDEKSGLCRTTKADKSAHGYGLKAAQAVVRKYQGELLLSFPDGSFSAAAALLLEPGL